MFNIQRFAGGGGGDGDGVTINGAIWVKLNSDNYTTYGVGLVPEGATVTGYNGYTYVGTQGSEDSAITTKIIGVNLFGNNTQTDPSAVTVALLEGVNISEVTVTNATSGLTITIDDTDYVVENGKLAEPTAEVIISSSINSSVRRPDGKIVTKNIPYINPNAADSDVATFMAALNSLSNNTTIAGGTVRVDKHAIG